MTKKERAPLAPPVLMTWAEFAARLGVSTATCDRRAARDPSFPKPVHLGATIRKMAVASEVEAYLSRLIGTRPTVADADEMAEAEA